MRILNLFVLPLVLFLTFAQSSNGQVFKTTMGFEFVQVQDEELGKVWMAPNGAMWSGVVGYLKNTDHPGTRPINGVIQKSDATLACANFGAELPTLEDYEGLRNYLEKKPGRSMLSEKGLRDLYSLFPDLNYASYFWTASVVPEAEGMAFIMDGVYGTLGSGVSERYFPVYVQCVKR